MYKHSVKIINVGYKVQTILNTFYTCLNIALVNQRYVLKSYCCLFRYYFSCTAFKLADSFTDSLRLVEYLTTVITMQSICGDS